MDTLFVSELILSIGSIAWLAWKIAGLPLLETESVHRAFVTHREPPIAPVVGLVVANPVETTAPAAFAAAGTEHLAAPATAEAPAGQLANGAASGAESAAPCAAVVAPAEADARQAATPVPTAMPETRPPDFQRLRWALSSEQVPMRLAAAAELSLIPGPEALALLAGVARDPDYELRRIAVQRLGAEKDPAHIDGLLQAARDVRIEVQNAACTGLIGAKDERVIDLFRRLALHGLHYARLLGIRGLGAAGGQERLLLEIYRNSTGKVREEAVVALAASSEPEALEAVREHLKLRMEQGPVGVKPEPVDEAQFRQVIEQEPSLALIEELEAAFKALPPSKRKGEVLAKLSAIAADGEADERRRYMAVRGIGFLGGLPVLEQLEAATHSPITAVRFGATIAIGRLRSGKAIDILKKALGDASFLVRAAAVAYLEQLGQSVERHLFEAAALDPDALVRDLAKKVLAARPAAPSPFATRAQAPSEPKVGAAAEASRPRTGFTLSAPRPSLAGIGKPDQALEVLLRPLRTAAMSRAPMASRFPPDHRKLTLSEVLRRA
ncbi:MAG: HEAT repeat domain-containing protein [Candidatus Wallbacteria bacterium]|nr:HEAT repeat domain-containing protein [Candidatus Wallbacteria bacterium]